MFISARKENWLGTAGDPDRLTSKCKKILNGELFACFLVNKNLSLNHLSTKLKGFYYEE